VRFEPTIPAFERAKTVHALDRAATVIGKTNGKPVEFSMGKFEMFSYLVMIFTDNPSSDPFL
jgi:hypothetical protein